MTDAQRMSWIAELREQVAPCEDDTAIDFNARNVALLLDFVEHLLLRIRQIEAREGLK